MINAEDIAKLHQPVMIDEVLNAFGLLSAHLKGETKIIDATLGLGGHTLEMMRNGASVLAIEADHESLKLARTRLEFACPTPNQDGWGYYKLVRGNFKNISEIAKDNGFLDSDGILMDLGVSSMQLTSKSWGFSFQNGEADLDMRVDRELNAVKASDLINLLRIDQLTELFGKVLDPRSSRLISESIIKNRENSPIKKVSDFRTIIESSLYRTKKVDLATLPFLALRIAVNSEIENLEEALKKSLLVLKSGGRIVVITFHSGEDKVVKKFFGQFQKENLGKVVTKKPVKVSEKEVSENPRSRSSKLRIFEKR